MTKRAQSKLWRLQTWTDGTSRSYPEPIDPPVVSTYRVLNNEVGYVLQGYPFNDNGVGPNATYRAIAAKADWVMLGAAPPSDVVNETTLIGQFRSLRSGCKMIRYTDPRYWYDGAGPGSNSAFIETYQIINTNSAPAIWTTKNAAGATLAHTWSPSNTNGINWAVVTGATNSLGQTLQQAARYQWQQNVPWTLYDGVFLDDMNTVANQLAIRNTTTEINYSYLQDGIDYDFRTDYTFGNAWRSGIAALVNEFRGISDQFLAMTNTADIGYWYLQYRFPFGFSSGGRPPTPFSSTAYSDLVDIGFIEVSYPQYGFGGYSGENGSGYPIRGYFSLANFYLAHELERQHCRTVITNRMGAQLVFHDAKTFSSNTAVETQTDYSYVRACWAMTKLVEGGAYGVCRTTRQPFFLDEICIKLGAVVGGPRSMGTLTQPDVSTNDPASFTLRTPNQTNGSAQFYWAEFENALVVFRGDITGLTPGSSFFGDGTTVSYTLPSAGAGYKWQRPNCNTYVNPDFADLAMVAQSPSFNNGADATTSTLKPLHGEVFLRVPSGQIMNTRFSGLSWVASSDYSPEGKDYLLSGTDTDTGQVFSTTSPRIWGGETAAPRIQLLNSTPPVGTPDTAWTRAFTANGLEITRNIPYVGVPQAVYRILPDAPFAQQGMVYIRGKFKLPAGMATNVDGSLLLASCKYNFTDSKIQIDLSRESGIWYLRCGAARAGSGISNIWGTGSTPNRNSTPLQDSFFSSPSGDISIFFKRGVFADDPAGAAPDLTRWYTYEMAFRLASPLGVVSGGAPSGWIWAATSVGTTGAPPANGTGTQRFYVRGDNMFVEPNPGATIIFPFGNYGDLPVQGLPLTWWQVEVWDRWPADASPYPVDAT